MSIATRTLCICVDDFGLHAGVNEAALGLAALDRVHAIGCLVGSAAWDVPWTEALRRLDPGRIDIGLHLDFTESPLLPRSRRRLPMLIAGTLLRRLDAPGIRAEIRAQLETFEQALGRRPAFVDGHQHVHQLPVVRHELLDELAHRYGAVRPWLRSTRTGAAIRTTISTALDAATGAPHRSHRQTAIKARVIEMLGARAFDSMARRQGFAQNHRLLGVYDFKGGAERYRRLMAAWLASAADADLLMCHPSRHLDERDPIAQARLCEHQVLAGAELATLMRDAAVMLAPMSRILSLRRDRA
jgi:chitin disaccharide deacetylase